MFMLRDDFASNDELVRQKAVERIVVHGETPTTFIEKKAASIHGHRSIPPILHAKIFKSFDELMRFAQSDEDLLCPDVQDQIRDFLHSIHIELFDTVFLAKRQPILTVYPESIPNYDVVLETEIITTPPVNIGEFESLAFDNNVAFRYTTNASFAMYLYQNILHFLDAKNVDELEDNNTWQAYLAVLIRQTDFNELVVQQAFLQDSVTYRGVVYDTTPIPKFDVRQLRPYDMLSFDRHDHNLPVSNNDMIKYYNTLNEKRTSRVPLEYIGIFLTFPFKRGHLIKPSGEIIHLKLHTYLVAKSSRLAMADLCDLSDVESAVEHVARVIPLDDAIYFAVYAKTLREQAMALLVLRRLVGATLFVGGERVQLASELTILSWTRLSCLPRTLTLPKLFSSSKAHCYVELIQDIAQSCQTALGATMLCSGFMLPEIHATKVYEQLSSDAERFVFFTLLMQDYPLEMFRAARKKLSPQFGNSVVDLSKYPLKNRIYDNSTVVDRLDTLSVPLIQPTDVTVQVSACPPTVCSEMYQFSDPQLAELVRTGDTTLNQIQLANFIALLIGLP